MKKKNNHFLLITKKLKNSAFQFYYYIIKTTQWNFLSKCHSAMLFNLSLFSMYIAGITYVC